jgi:hypothetical protein
VQSTLVPDLKVQMWTRILLIFMTGSAPTSPWLSIWPNVVTDLFAIWAGVSTIDGTSMNVSDGVQWH